ncbi:MAG: GGDEF domain-containing protein [Kineosporiaceae bacterium]
MDIAGAVAGVADRASRHVFPGDGDVLRAMGAFVLGILPLSLVPLWNAHVRGDADVILAGLCTAAIWAAGGLVLWQRRRLTRVVVAVVVLLDVAAVAFGLSQTDTDWAKVVPVLHLIVTVLVAFSLPGTALRLQILVSVAAAVALFSYGVESWSPEEVADVAVGTAVVTLGFLVTGASIRMLTGRLHQALADAERRSQRDPLTDVLNRRGLELELPPIVGRARRNGADVAVLLADLDHFKRVNDAHGHATGDAVLVATARAMQLSLRADDALARLGGEEFVIVAMVDGEPSAMAERLRQAVNAANSLLSVTVSIGVAQRPPPGPGTDAVEWLYRLVEEADERLYTAKRTGRNRCVGQPTGDPPTAVTGRTAELPVT